MKRKFIQILGLTMILCMTGCGSPSADEAGQDEQFTASETVPENSLVYDADGASAEKASSIIVDGKLSDEGSLGGFKYRIGATDYYDVGFKDRGYYSFSHDARAPLVIELCSGMHPTGGYGIEVVDLQVDEKNNLSVIVQETAPKPEYVVTDAFTYPKVTLLIYEESGMPESVSVKTVDGDDFPFLGNMPSDFGEDETAAGEHYGWEKVVAAPVEGAYCHVSVLLPEDWDYSWSQTDDVPVSCITLGIFPKAEGDASGCIAITYAKDSGICGTGLESVETTFNGHAAYKGTYDGHSYWDFINLKDEYRDCYVWNYAGETWFDKYQKELSEILATVEFKLCEGVPLKNPDQSDMEKGYEKAPDLSDIGEIYEKEFAQNDIAVTADGMKYVKNQLLVSASFDCTKEKMESLGEAYGFQIVGYIELTQDYQIDFNWTASEADLMKMIKILEEEDFIYSCTLNYVMEIGY